MKTLILSLAVFCLPSLASAQCATCQQQLYAQPIVQAYGVQQFVQPLAIQSYYAAPIIQRQVFAQQAYVQPFAVQSYSSGFAIQRQAFVQPAFRSSFIQQSNFGFARQRGFSLSVFR